MGAFMLQTLPAHLPRAQLLLIRILQTQNMPSPLKRLYPDLSNLAFFFFFLVPHLDMRPGNKGMVTSF